MAVGLAIYSSTELVENTYFGEDAAVGLSSLASLVGAGLHQQGPIRPAGVCGLILIGMTVVFLAAVAFYRQRAPLAITLADLCPDAALLDHDPLVGQRGAQPLVRLLVRP